MLSSMARIHWGVLMDTKKLMVLCRYRRQQLFILVVKGMTAHVCFCVHLVLLMLL